MNEGAVKAFEMAIDTLINHVKKGYGWIDPDYVYDSLEAIDNSINWNHWDSLKDEVYKRLIDADILYFANDSDPNERGKKVTNSNQID
jgi:hypothetical protein